MTNSFLPCQFQVDAIMLMAEEASDRVATLGVVTFVVISSHLPHYERPFMPTITPTIQDGVLSPMLRLAARLKTRYRCQRELNTSSWIERTIGA